VFVGGMAVGDARSLSTVRNPLSKSSVSFDMSSLRTWTVIPFRRGGDDGGELTGPIKGFGCGILMSKSQMPASENEDWRECEGAEKRS